jgi:hypothetical protein
MAKIFYIHLKDEKQVMGYFFNDKRKAQKKGEYIYDDFEFGLDGEKIPTLGFGLKSIYSGEIDIKKGLLFYRERETADVKMEDMSEEDAKSKVEEIDGSGAYFPVKLKNGYGDSFVKRAPTHTGALWQFYHGNIYENKTTMKHVKLFEAFVNEATRLRSKRD